MSRRAGVVLRAVVIVLVLAACGGGGTKKVPAAAWAADVCNEVVSWQEQIESLVTTMVANVEDAGEDLRAARAELVDFLESMVERTDRMIAGIDDAGVPDTARGEEIAQDFERAMQQVRQAFVVARERAGNLSVTDPAAFRDEGEEVGNDLAEAGERAAEQFGSFGDTYDAPALETAFEEAPECQDVSTSEGVAATTWAEEVCGQLVSWQERIESLSADLESQAETAAGDLPALRTRLVGFISAVIEATEGMIETVDEAGAPDVERGQEIADDLGAALQQVRAVFVEGRANAENLAVDDPAAFQAGAEQIATEIQQAGTRIEQGFQELDEKYDMPSLDQAFGEAPSCEQLDIG